MKVPPIYLKTLKELDQHEQKYTTEFDIALQKYLKTNQEPGDFESGELMKSQQGIRSVRDRIAVE